MRRGGVFWGVLVLLAGVLFLLDNLDFLPISAWSLIFPGALILIGLWFLLGPLVFRQVVESRNLAIPLDGISEAKIKIRHGGGTLKLAAATATSNLLEGSFSGGVEEKVERNGSTAAVKLRLPDMEWWGFPSAFPREGLQWNMLVNKDVAYSFNLKTGASKTHLDLRELIVTDIRLETGASDTEIFLPGQAGFTSADFHFGSAKVELHVPHNVAARIKIDGALMNTEEIDKARFPQVGTDFCSPDYATAVNKVDISIEAGVGKIVIN